MSSPHTLPLTLPDLAEEAREIATEPGTGLGGKAACGAGGQSRTLAPGRQPSSTVEKRLGTKEASRQASRLLLPCRFSAGEPDLRARLGQVLTRPQEAVKVMPSLGHFLGCSRQAFRGRGNVTSHYIGLWGF